MKKVMKSQQIKQKECRNEGCDNTFTPFRTTDKYCSYNCAKSNEKPKKRKFTPIRQVSKKQGSINRQYSKDRKVFLSKPENKKCFIDGCNREGNTVEHTKGRGHGYFDDWAEQKGICKTLDQRYWKPCCIQHNLELERNSKLSKKYQLSKLHNGSK